MRKAVLSLPADYREVVVLCELEGLEYAEAAVARLEIVTEFVPLRYGRLIEPGEFAQVMRVSLPRSSLSRLGILVVPELDERRVKADVLVGEDGLARAVRFVK